VADRLTWRRYYARGTRHDHESYGAVCDTTSASRGLAYHRVGDKREGLVYRADPTAVEVLVSQGTYILSPVLAGGYLIWTELRRGAWIIRAISTSNVATGRIVEPVACAGRPIHLNAATREGQTVLVWEERSGKRTRIRGVVINAGQFGQPVDMTAGVSNAYDPQCIVLHDGRVGLIYSAFTDGQYRIYIQFFSDVLYPVGMPVRVSDGISGALYPSLCERSEGGVWFSFAQMAASPSREHVVKHGRHRDQTSMFAAPMRLMVGALHNEHVYAPYAPPDGEGLQGHMASMIVFGSEGSAQSRVFEDDDGRLRVLLRQHCDRERTSYEDDDRVLVRSKLKGAVEGGHCYASICLMSLLDDRWSKPQVLISAAHVKGPLSYLRDGRMLSFAFTEDGRHTGWNAAGEWMDAESEVAVGAAEVELSAGDAPRYDMRPFGIAAVPSQGVTDPTCADGAGGDYQVALGQLHAHSEVSVCHRAIDGDAHFNYRFLQDVQHCDFGAITDHAFNMWHTEMLLMRKFAQYYYFPGEFVAIQGHEWTGSSMQSCRHDGGPWGHVTPLLLDEDSDLVCYYPGDEACEGSSLPRLVSCFGDQPVVAPPHHMADALHPFKWGNFDAGLMSVVELFQDGRGSCESPSAPGVSRSLHVEQGPWCDTELLSGKRFGFIAGADHGGVARAGILTRALTREALYEAVSAKRCFATTGVGIEIEFSCNGQAMGSSIETTEGEFSLGVVAPEPLHAVHLMHNGHVAEGFAVHGTEFHHTWSVKRRRHGEFWYCRILLASGELAWTSPIWLD
jgi:hypothetical protein